MRPRIITIEDICRKLRPIFGSKIDQLYMKYTLLDDRNAKMEIEQALRALYQKYLSDSLLNEELLLEPPTKQVIKGDYPLGTVIYGKRKLHQFGLREKDWMRHVMISGMSGGGKTTFAFQILGNFIFKNKPFLVFDWKKSFRPLMLLNEKMRIFTVGQKGPANFRLNITKPPVGVHPKEWIGLLADLITESYSASFGVHKLLVDVMDQAFLEFGIYAGSENYPTFKQIRDRLEEKAHNQTRKSRESEWLESAMRIAHSLTFGTFGESICYKGYDARNIEDLFQEQTVFELASLTNTEKKFFCQFALTYIYKYAKAGNVNITEEFKFAILVDEAHNIFLKDRPNFISESVPDMIFREIREYGVSLITLDQHISKLSDVVAGNSATNIAFQQMLPNDIETISRLMQLYDYKSYFSKLPVGAAIVKLVERYQDPFLIQAPLMKIKGKRITDKEIIDHMQKLMGDDKRKKEFEKRCQDERLAKEVKKLSKIKMVAGVDAKEEDLEEELRAAEAVQAAQAAQHNHEQAKIDKIKSPGIKNHLQQKILDHTRKRLLNGEDIDHIRKWWINEGYKRSDIMQVFNYIKRNKIAEKTGATVKKKLFTLTPEQIHFLKIVRSNHDVPVSQIYAKADLSPRKGNNIRQELEDLDVIEIMEERTDKGWTKHVKINYTPKITSLLDS